MRRAPILGVAALAATAALVLSGCLAFKTGTAPFGSQLNFIGNVRITTTICQYENMTPTCNTAGNSPFEDGTQPGQGLLGYRIPTAAGAPPGFLSTDTTVTMTQSPAYSAELQRVAPAPAGQKWVGYISQVGTLAAGVEKTFSPEFTLSRGVDGSPFQTPFLFQVVVGGRWVTAEAPSTRPVVCGTSVAAFSDPNAMQTNGTTVCFNLPKTDAEIAMNITRTTRDLGIVAPTAPVTVQRGQAGVITFRAKQSGVSSGPTFTISAQTTLAGATAAPNVINYVPNPNQDAPVSVLVNVPPNATAGTYDVALTATSGLGATLQTRIGVGKLLVPPPPPPGAAPAKRINARVRYRVSVGSRIRILSMRALGAPNGAKIAVSCKNGNCRLARIKGTRIQTRLSRGRPVDITNIFRGQVLRPGVTVEVRITKKNFVGRFFRFTFTRTNVKTIECDITLAGRTKRCVRL